MLQINDRVYIDGTHEQGTVTAVHPLEITVIVNTPTGREHRTYAYESLRLDPAMHEASSPDDR